MIEGTFTERVARIACQWQWESLTQEQREIAAQCVLDWFGVALRGSAEPVAGILWDDALGDGGDAVASVVGRGAKLSMPQAALVNGAASHALDYDDAHADIGHPSVAILPALLAMAEARRASGRSVLTAFVAGYEAAAMVGAAIGQDHYNRGFHTTATIGIFGAAVACAKLLGLPLDGVRRAIGIAATQAAGMKAMFGTMGKPFHAGRVARDGLLAARLSAAGLTAADSILDGKLGFLSVLGSGTNHLHETVEMPFALGKNLFKYHAACYLTHAAINSAQVIARDQRFNPSDVQRVVVTASTLIDDVCNIRQPETGLEMKFSIRYAVAAALAGFDMGNPDTYSDENVREISGLPLTERVTVNLVPGLPRSYACVDVQMRSGEALTESADSNRPATDLEAQRHRLIEKFHQLHTRRLGREQRERFVSAVFALPECCDVGELFSLLNAQRNIMEEKE
ncbi:MAG: MmgE/PrpD family protein [Cupriavidus necator]